MVKRLRNEAGSTPHFQTALLLNAPRESYHVVNAHPAPELISQDEVLIQVEVIGLNPIDWKTADYGFGIPQLPYISGREFVGTVVATRTVKARVGDRVIAISTDYRDLRKAAFQQFSVANYFNTVRLPRSISAAEGSSIGVAFVAAMLTLGMCLEVSFEQVGGPHLRQITKSLSRHKIPGDVREECFNSMKEGDRPVKGDWIAIWGGSSTCALVLNQLARLVGLRTILILDKRKHENLLRTHDGYKSDAIIDDQDSEEAVKTIRRLTNNSLRFGVDAVGRDTAEHLAECLLWRDRAQGISRLTPPKTPPYAETTAPASHLVGLGGIPKQKLEAIAYHSVPVKIFHEVREIGEAMVEFLFQLLEEGKLKPPRILGTLEGLAEVNTGLDRMRARQISGGRLTVRLPPNGEHSARRAKKSSS